MRKGDIWMKANMIILGNSIFDSVSTEPFAGFIAVKGNRIIAVERGDDYASFADSDTKILRYDDKTIMAGFHDSHAHFIMAGLFNTYVNMRPARSEEEAAKMVWDSHPADDGKWVIGFGWYHVFWEKVEFPTKATLDRYYPNTPVCLINAEAHGAWVNSKAMEIAGINKDTPEPFGGEIFRDAKGEPTGFLGEAAAGLVTKYAFDFTAEEEKNIIRSYMKGAKRYGITSVNDVQPYFHGNMGNLDVYRAMDQSGELTVRVNVAPDLLGDLDQVEQWREEYRSDKIRVSMLKQFLDGVCTTHTALVIDDYTDMPGNRGISPSDLEAIRKAVPEGHRRGFSIKLHSCGDLSARMALDFYEEAIKMYGKNQCRHAIEHIEMLDPADLPRFGELGIIPSVQPQHMALTETFAENPYPVVLGEERAYRGFPYKSLYDTAGLLALGSDCPVVDDNPFLEIYRGVTRIHDDGEPQGGWNPAEKISLYEALRSYTYGSAYGAGREDELGTLEAGKFADIIVIDRDLFAVDESELINATVEVTIMDGNIIYEKSAAC